MGKPSANFSSTPTTINGMPPPSLAVPTTDLTTTDDEQQHNRENHQTSEHPDSLNHQSEEPQAKKVKKVPVPKSSHKKSNDAPTSVLPVQGGENPLLSFPAGFTPSPHLLENLGMKVNVPDHITDEAERKSYIESVTRAIVQGNAYSVHDIRNPACMSNVFSAALSSLSDPSTFGLETFHRPDSGSGAEGRFMISIKGFRAELQGYERNPTTGEVKLVPVIYFSIPFNTSGKKGPLLNSRDCYVSGKAHRVDPKTGEVNNPMNTSEKDMMYYVGPRVASDAVKACSKKSIPTKRVRDQAASKTTSDQQTSAVVSDEVRNQTATHPTEEDTH